MDTKQKEINRMYFSPYRYKAIDSLDRGVATKISHSRVRNYKNYRNGLIKTNIDPFVGNTFVALAKYIVSHLFIIWVSSCILIASVVCIAIVSNYSFSLPKVSSLRTQLNTPFPLTIVQDSTEIEALALSTSDFSQVEIQEYTLQSGDMLLRIAKKFNLVVDTIVSWNDIRDARRIRAGDTIIIPNKNGILHKVVQGDSINELSKRYGITAVSILDANNLASNQITRGTKLFIPGAKMNSFDLGLVLGTTFLSPTRGRISSHYGYRTSPITGLWSFHGGIDIANRSGSRVSAATYGKVSYVANNSPVYGKMVIIKHPGGFQTLYGHLDKIVVRKGQSISRGQKIGTMGNTGLSTGPHLHFTVIENGVTVNPLRYIRF